MAPIAPAEVLAARHAEAGHAAVRPRAAAAPCDPDPVRPAQVPGVRQTGAHPSAPSRAASSAAGGAPDAHPVAPPDTPPAVPGAARPHSTRIPPGRPRLP